MNASEAAPGAGAAGPADTATIDALKRIKATETEWEEKVTSVRSDTEAALKRLKEETDALLAQARTEAETERTRTIEAARAGANAEAAKIVAEGERTARAATEGAGKGVAARKSEVLAVVLGGFLSD